MSILVIGGSSQIGVFLLPRLRQQGHAVLALSRKPCTQNGQEVRWLQGDIESLPKYSGLTAVVSFGPMDGVAMWLARHSEAPAPKLIVTSSMSAESKRHSSIAEDRALSQWLRDAEDALLEQCRRLHMQCLIFRPTLIYGAGRDKSLTPIVRRALRWSIFPIPQARGLRQPVHADDIAQAVIAALALPKWEQPIIEIGGGERLPYHAMFRRIYITLPKRVLPLPLPLWSLRLAACLHPRFRGPVSRLEEDLLADNRALESLLRVKPRLFHPDVGAWRFECETSKNISMD